MFEAVCCQMQICGKILILRLISYAQRVQINLFFSNLILSHKLQLLNVRHNFCSVTHCTNMNTDFIDLGNNILCALCSEVPTNKIDASICIRIRPVSSHYSLAMLPLWVQLPPGLEYKANLLSLQA